MLHEQIAPLHIGKEQFVEMLIQIICAAFCVADVSKKILNLPLRLRFLQQFKELIQLR